MVLSFVLVLKSIFSFFNWVEKIRSTLSQVGKHIQLISVFIFNKSIQRNICNRIDNEKIDSSLEYFFHSLLVL